MPKAFRFRLEPLLDFRRLKEDLAKRGLAEASRAAQEQKQKVLRLLSDEDEEKKALREVRIGPMNVVEMRLHEGYQVALDRQLRRESAALRDRQAAEAEKRRALIDAAKNVKVLERLRERRRRGYLYELDRQEQKDLDEIVRSGDAS